MNHKHIRTVVETPNSLYILQEATIANIVRAYITLKTHPTQVGIELTGRSVDSPKEYAEYQLIETPKTSQEVIQELTEIID